MSNTVTDAGAKMGSLNASKETLLSILRDAAAATPFDEKKAWNAINLISGASLMVEIAGVYPTPGKTDTRRYKALAGALRKAADLLAEENSPDTGGWLMDIWYHDNIEPPT